MKNLSITSLVTGETLAQIFGESICMPFFMAQTFHNFWMTMTGFGISLFRFTCIWDNLLIFEKEKLKRLMERILIGEVVMTSGLVSLGKRSHLLLELHENKDIFIFSYLWGLPHPKSSSFRFLLWVWTRNGFSYSIQCRNR